MSNSVILVTKKNISYLNKNIKKINSKIKLNKDHLELYLSWIVMTNDQKKAKWMKDVNSIEELLYPSLSILKKDFLVREASTVFDFFDNYGKAIQGDIQESSSSDFLWDLEAKIFEMPNIPFTITTTTSTNTGHYYYNENGRLQRLEDRTFSDPFAFLDDDDE